MARGRMVSKSISVSEKVNYSLRERMKDSYSQEDIYLAMLLYTWLIPHADDWGRLDGSPFYIKNTVVPAIETVTTSKIEELLCVLRDVGLLILYGESKPCIQIVNFDDHQSGLHKRTENSKFPDPPGISRNFPEFPGISCLTEENRTEQNITEQKRKRGWPGGGQKGFPEQIFEAYSTINDGTLPVAKALSDERRRKINARASDKGFFENFKNAVTIAIRTPFLSGENDRGWVADFDWFIANGTNVLKVIEGKYSNHKRIDPTSGAAIRKALEARKGVGK